MGDLDLYQRNDALPHSYTLKRDEPVKHDKASPRIMSRGAICPLAGRA